MSKPKCPECGSVDFEVNSSGFPPMKTASGVDRVFIPKNFICCEKCGTIISEYGNSDDILKMIEAINDKVSRIEPSTHPRGDRFTDLQAKT